MIPEAVTKVALGYSRFTSSSKRSAISGGITVKAAQVSIIAFSKTLIFLPTSLTLTKSRLASIFMYSPKIETHTSFLSR